jgi:hypothetical protein
MQFKGAMDVHAGAPFCYAAGMSLTKLSLEGDNLIIPGQGEYD